MVVRYCNTVKRVTPGGAQSCQKGFSELRRAWNIQETMVTMSGTLRNMKGDILVFSLSLRLFLSLSLDIK